MSNGTHDFYSHFFARIWACGHSNSRRIYDMFSQHVKPESSDIKIDRHFWHMYRIKKNSSVIPVSKSYNRLSKMADR